jgi:hypothetical protein
MACMAGVETSRRCQGHGEDAIVHMAATISRAEGWKYAPFLSDILYLCWSSLLALLVCVPLLPVHAFSRINIDNDILRFNLYHMLNKHTLQMRIVLRRTYRERR